MQCHTENYVPPVVPGLSNGSSSSSTPTSPTSLSQDSVNSTMQPGTARSENVRKQAQGYLSPDPARKLVNQKMKKAS